MKTQDNTSNSKNGMAVARTLAVGSAFTVFWVWLAGGIGFNYAPTIFLQNKIGWIIASTIGLIGGAFFVYFVLIGLLLIIAPIISTIKILAEDYSAGKATLSTASGATWNDPHLGVTMPDGGESVAKKREKKQAK